MIDPSGHRLQRAIGPQDHVRGPADAPITLVEYGDYECPHCRAAYPIVERLLQHAGRELRFVYRHFPLTAVHLHAEAAAEAAEAAAAQDAFWDMHERLYRSRGPLDEAELLEEARGLGLDTPRFQRELEAGTYRTRVRADVASGARSGVNGTPTFFVNGERYDGGYEGASLTRAIERVLEGARQT